MCRRKLLLMFLGGLSAGCGGSETALPAPSPSPIPGPTPVPIVGTHVSIVSDPGDTIGQGETRAITLADADFDVQFKQASFGKQFIKITVTKIDVNDLNNYILWTFLFQSPNNKSLAPGVYTPVVLYPSLSGNSEMSVTMSGRGCESVTGSFTLHSIDGDINLVVRSLHLTFEQHCDGASPSLRGEIVIEPVGGQ